MTDIIRLVFAMRREDWNRTRMDAIVQARGGLNKGAVVEMERRG